MSVYTPEEYNAAYVRGQETGREQGRQEVLAKVREVLQQAADSPDVRDCASWLGITLEDKSNAE